MERFVFVVDTSGSMKCHETSLKDYLKVLIDAFTVWGTGDDKIALVSFSNDVSIQSHYTKNATELKNVVNGLVFAGLTAFDDAILTGLVFENPKPDTFLVFSDSGDNCSDAEEAVWSSLASALGITVTIIPPSDNTYKGNCTFRRYFTLNPITPKMAIANAMQIAGRVKMAKVIQKSEDLVMLKPVKTQLLKRATTRPS